MWTDVIFEPPALIGTMLENNWIQCPQCADAYEIAAGRPWVVCEHCERLVKRNTP